MSREVPNLDLDHLRQVLELSEAQPPNFINVGGVSAAGKTTVARALAAGIPQTKILSVDSYLGEGLWDQNLKFNHDSPDPNRPFIGGISPEIWDLNLLEKHLDMLGRQQTVNVPIFDETIKDRVGAVSFGPSRNIVLEGGHSFTERFLSRALYKILVEAPLHDRLTRKMVRTHLIYKLIDVDEILRRYVTRDEPVRKIYQEEQQALADQIVANPANPAVDYQGLETPLNHRAKGIYRSLVPHEETGGLHAQERLGIIQKVVGGLVIDYEIAGRKLIHLPILEKTARLLGRHYELEEPSDGR